jgi:hypothetical protein
MSAPVSELTRNPSQKPLAPTLRRVERLQPTLRAQTARDDIPERPMVEVSPSAAYATSPPSLDDSLRGGGVTKSSRMR